MRPAHRLALARTLAWSLLMNGWLQLGALGHAGWPLTAGGLLPTAAWLAVIAATQSAQQHVRLGAGGLRAWLGGSAGLAMAGLVGATAAPGLAFAAAVGWGLLLVGASRCVRALRDGQAPLPVVPAAAGTALAWAAGFAGAGASAALVATAAAVLALLVPAGARSRGCRSGLFDCVLPTLHALPTDAGGWLHAALRWAMLPMMATLVAMGDWCGSGLGWSPQAMIGLHLAAMLMPPLVLRLCHCTLQGPLWVALPLLIALLLLAWPPAALSGLSGLMAASLACALAWGLGWQAHPSRTPGTSPAAPLAAFVPALCAVALGVALERFGPTALGAALLLPIGVALSGAAWLQCARGWRRQRPLDA